MKNKIADGEIVYSINVGDLQDISKDFLGRPLTNDEITLVQRSVGDYLDWTQAIELAIREHVSD